MTQQLGRFISFEGIDGAGKSTHVAWCVDWLKAQGVKVVAVREPGGTPMGEQLRSVLLAEPMSALAETLIMFAARHQLLETVIRPALNRGDWVVSDRFVDASFAYQGGGRHIAQATLIWLKNQCVGATMPECTFWFDVALSTAEHRRKVARTENANIADRFEQENHDFFARVREGYRQIYLQEPQRVHCIDSTQTIDDIRAQLTMRLSALMKQK